MTVDHLCYSHASLRYTTRIIHTRISSPAHQIIASTRAKCKFKHTPLSSAHLSRHAQTILNTSISLYTCAPTPNTRNIAHTQKRISHIVVRTASPASAAPAPHRLPPQLPPPPHRAAAACRWRVARHRCDKREPFSSTRWKCRPVPHLKCQITITRTRPHHRWHPRRRRMLITVWALRRRRRHRVPRRRPRIITVIRLALVRVPRNPTGKSSSTSARHQRVGVR